MTVAFASRYDIPFFTGIPSAAPAVPSVWEVAIGGHTYLLDLRQEGLFGHQTIPHQRPQSFTSTELGERALNPDAGWRVSQSSWEKGAGQVHLDLGTSDRSRFFASKGINPWTQWQFSLLNDVTQVRASANTNLNLLSVGTYFYISDGNEVYWSTNLSSFTAATINIAEGANAVRSIATDGFHVFAALAANGVHYTNKGAGVSTHMNDLTNVDVLRWVKGRLLAAKTATQAIYVLPAIGTTAAPAATFTHPNSDWAWVDFCEGSSNIYAAGWSGDRSEVYRIGIKTDGSGLNAAVIAAALPAGEIAYSLGNYLGFVLIGTNVGVRVCTPDSNGDLTLGPVITTPGPVRCFIGHDRFVWFGWENYDASSSGLGRLDLTVFNDIAPAYASDLMGPSGTVTSCGTFAGVRVFAVNAVGFYTESTIPVSTGYLDTGLITYDIAEPKVAVAINVRHQNPLRGTHTVSITGDDEVLTSLGSVVYNGNVSAQETRAEHFGVRHTLTYDGTNSPTVRRWTMVAMPAPRSAEKISVPIQVFQTQEANGTVLSLDVLQEYEYLTGLRDSREVVTYQEGSKSYTVTMTDYRWVPSTEMTHEKDFWQGTLVVELTTVDTT